MSYTLEVLRPMDATGENWFVIKEARIAGTPSKRRIIKELKALMGLTGRKARVIWREDKVQIFRHDAPEWGLGYWAEEEE